MARALSFGTTSELAIRRYAIISQYLASDNAIFWNRNNIFSAANIGLIAILASHPNSSNVALQRLLPLIECLLGFFVCLIWICLIAAGIRWLKRCESILRKLEGPALDWIEFHQNANSRVHWTGRSRNLAKALACGFLIFWMVAFICVLVSRVPVRPWVPGQSFYRQI